MSSAVAPGGSIMAIGLPGTILTTTKTMTAIPKSAISVDADRANAARRSCIAPSLPEFAGSAKEPGAMR